VLFAASCSDDRTVIIWKEKEVGVQGQQGPQKIQFVEAKKITDFTKGVSSIAFGPSHLGLQIASACNDGKVRIHLGRATDLSRWDLQSEFEPEGSGIGAYVTCLSWNHNRVDKPMLVVGCWRVTAAPDQTGSRPVTSSVTVWALSGERWAQVAKLDMEAVGKGVGSEVRDVDWAPSMGRPDYFIAAAVGSTVQVWRLDPQQCLQLSAGHVEKPISVLSAQSEDLPSVNMAFWKVSWNLTGTCLAASAENGQVRMWKLDFQGNLKPHLTLEPQP
jgi:nucleoporin SEH1